MRVIPPDFRRWILRRLAVYLLVVAGITAGFFLYAGYLALTPS